MYKVTFLPDNVTVETEEGVSLLDLANQNGVFIDSNCGGFCACSTCHVIIKKGMEHLPESTEEEEDQLEEATGLTLTSRLSCQCVLGENSGGEGGELIVEVPIHNRNAPGIIGGHTHGDDHDHDHDEEHAHAGGHSHEG